MMTRHLLLSLLSYCCSLWISLSCLPSYFSSSICCHVVVAYSLADGHLPPADASHHIPYTDGHRAKAETVQTNNNAHSHTYLPQLPTPSASSISHHSPSASPTSSSAPPSSSWQDVVHGWVSAYGQMCGEVADFLWPVSSYQDLQEESGKANEEKKHSASSHLDPPAPPDNKRTYRVNDDGSFSLVLPSSSSSRDHSNPFQDLWLFVEAVNWLEPFIVCLCLFHILLFLFILVFSKNFQLYVQCFILLIICMCVYLTQPLGELAHGHWNLFVAQPYFDPRGPFVLLVWAAPLLLSLLLLVVQLLREASRMLVVVKRKELQLIVSGDRKKRDEQKQLQDEAEVETEQGGAAGREKGGREGGKDECLISSTLCGADGSSGMGQEGTTRRRGVEDRPAIG
eukprot:GHVS01091622.1.p1 GENE.GHVS01091622.1~~GHVS01091622.1.p1  ORF type:complete len:397 (-),score=66.44 GHVS01091622.1:241-1431(-)